MNPVLTIAIPVYNMEKYLERCLSSVLYEGCPPDVEIVIINDGSRDNSKNIIDKYVLLYPEQVVAIHKENGGWGSCVNKAMRKAAGKYFRILDSDDCFDRSGYETCVQNLRSLNCDIYACCYREIYPDQTRCYNVVENLSGKTLTIEEYLANPETQGKLFPLAAICYKTAVLRGLIISPRYYADLEYDIKPLAIARTIFLGNEEVYQYYRSYDEQSTSIKGYTAHKNDYLTQCKKLVSFYVDFRANAGNNVLAYVRERTILCLLALYNFHLSHMYSSNHEDECSLRKFDTWLRSASFELWSKMNKRGVKYFIPFVWIWRMFNINLKK